MKSQNIEQNKKETGYLLFSIFLISGTAISYEILLMRLLSIIQWHHFVYMIISLALLGYGASGTFLALARPWVQKHFKIIYLINGFTMSFSMLSGFTLTQHVPFNPLEVLWDPWQQFNLLTLYLLLFIPFFCAANCIALTFMRYQKAISRIYRSDLLGAGTGSLLVLLILFLFQPASWIKILATLPLFAILLLIGDRTLSFKPKPVLLLVTAGFIFLALWPSHWVQPRISEYKGLSQILEVMDTEIIDELSSPFGLLTIVKSTTVPFRYAPGLSLNSPKGPPSQLGIFTDGDGLSVITEFKGDKNTLSYLGYLLSAAPYHLFKNPKVLVLGAGGGSDVLLAYYHGAASIDAVELNPQMVQLVQKKYSQFAGGIYNLENVQVKVAEGRGFVSGTNKRYDLIHLPPLGTFSASTAGAYALSEGYLYTVEAFIEYLSHLEPNGTLSITQWLKLPPRDTLKLFATAVEALQRLGVRNPGQQMVLIRNWNTTLLLIKNGDFSKDEIQTLRAFSSARSFDVAYHPEMLREESKQFNLMMEPYLFDGTMALLGEERGKFYAQYKFFIEPATDNQPYFSRFFKWQALPELLSLRERGGLPLVEWGYLLLWVTLIQACLVSFVLILLPLFTLRQARITSRFKFQVGFYFLALGLAFLFIEIVFIQKFILFLNHPIYATAIVLGSFLFFAGLGSGYSKTFSNLCKKEGCSAIFVSILGITFYTIAFMFLSPFLFQSLLPLPPLVRGTLSIILIAPLAFCMGMPFPLGLSKVALSVPSIIPWAWGINGCASVLSAILATILTIHLGFNMVLVLAVILYLLAATALQKD